MSGINTSCSIIPGIASINPPTIKASIVKAFPAIPSSKAFIIPHTIRPAIIDTTNEKYKFLLPLNRYKNPIINP